MTILQYSTTVTLLIFTISNFKNDVLTMITLFPDHSRDFEDLDFSIEDKEELIYESLSTPNFKLYYPEPYIASPSFNHEDL